MNNLQQFEQHANAQFAEQLPKVLDLDEDNLDEGLKTIIDDTQQQLEADAIQAGVETCPRSAFLLVFGLTDFYMEAHAEELHVPPEYFGGPREEDEARAYVEERRLGLPIRCNCLTGTRLN